MAPDPSPKCIYGSLTDPKSIRVLIIPTIPSVTLSCRLLPTQLSSVPYKALSYTWGSPIKTRTIILNDEPFYIGENLWIALNAIKSHYSNSPTKEVCIWIDAICINQEDIPERNQQVAIMSSIYRGAEEVLVWLGPGDKSSDVAMSVLGTEATKDDVLAVLPDIQTLFNRSYFSRMWIVQEVVLGANITVCCGEKAITWKQLVGLFETFQHDSWKLGATTLAQQLYTSKRRVSGQDGKYNANGWLVALLSNHLEYHCYDPRDKIFALLGIAIDTQKGQLVADYGKQLDAVYQDVIKFWTNQPGKNRHHLNMMRYSQMLQRSLGRTFRLEDKSEQTLLPVSGYECGTVTRLGPKFCVEDFNKVKDLDQLTRHIQSVFTTATSPYVACYRAEGGVIEPSNATLKALSQLWLSVPSLRDPTSGQEMRFFQCENRIGIGPSGIILGDTVCQFYDTDVAAVLRTQPFGKCLSIVGSVVLFLGPENTDQELELGLEDWLRQMGRRVEGKRQQSITRYDKTPVIVLWIDIPLLQRFTRHVI